MKLYYCETIHAVSSRWHLREADGQKKLGGGVNKPTLCGLTAAWDINREVEDRDLEKLACRKCLEAYRK